jgi:hypothetical protein
MNKNITIVTLLVILSLVNFSITLYKLSNFNHEVTGKVSGYVNVTISQIIAIELLRDDINWGSGALNGTGSDSFNATLFTEGNLNGTVLRGNWSGENVTGFILQNLGNINCSLSIQTYKDAHDFFSSESFTNEEYKIKVSNNLPQSCFGYTDTWIDSNKTNKGSLYCFKFNHLPGQNEIFIDVLLTVPFDGLNNGAQADTITIYGSPEI